MICGKMSVAAIQAQKVALRGQIKKILPTLTSDEKNRQSKVVFEKLKTLPVYKDSKRISVYLSMDSEIDTYPILKDILESNKKCFVPRYDGNVMQMVALTSMADYDSLPLNKWSIKQPRLKETREDALQTGGLDLVIMPGVAFTKDGKRCGHGKGYYDSFLTKLFKSQEKKPITVAIAFKEQVKDDIPVHDHDVIIDHVLYDN